MIEERVEDYPSGRLIIQNQRNKKIEGILKGIGPVVHVIGLERSDSELPGHRVRRQRWARLD
jgi:hypothetical protein